MKEYYSIPYPFVDSGGGKILPYISPCDGYVYATICVRKGRGKVLLELRTTVRAKVRMKVRTKVRKKLLARNKAWIFFVFFSFE